MDDNSNYENKIARLSGDKNYKFTKICLNKPNTNCEDPPCWHNVEDNIICNPILTDPSKRSEICKKTPLKEKTIDFQ